MYGPLSQMKKPYDFHQKVLRTYAALVFLLLSVKLLDHFFS